ncbi:MAG: hypothetical protein B7Z22_07195, partial [Hyphomonas sp. 32-62-5]
MARAEIVDGEFGAHRPQRRDEFRHTRRVRHRHAFGDLQLQPPGVEPGAAQRAHYSLGQVIALELARRNVHRDRHIMAFQLPGPGRLAGCLQDLLADLLDQARFLRHRNKSGRRNQLAIRAPPTGQRLSADNAARGKIDLRLEHGLELAGAGPLIGVIDAGGGHPDEHLPRSWGGDGHVDRTQRQTVPGQDEGLHDVSSRRDSRRLVAMYNYFSEHMLGSYNMQLAWRWH